MKVTFFGGRFVPASNFNHSHSHFPNKIEKG